MKFIGIPGMLVRDRKKKKNYRFDKDGILETDNKRLIRALAIKFLIFNESEKTEPIKPIEEKKSGAEGLVCPQCGRTCKTPSGLASHMKACKGA